MNSMINNLKLNGFGETIGRFVRWWVSELSSMLPARWRQMARTRRDRLIVQFTDPHLVVSQCTGETARELGRYRLAPDAIDEEEACKAALAQLPVNGMEVVLRLSARDVLSKTFGLPIEAGENLREVLAFEMDRKTPFRAEQVYYDAQMVARQPGAREMKVKLWVVPRQALDVMLERMARLGLHPSVVDALDADPRGDVICSESAVNLLPQQRRTRAKSTGTRLNLALTILAALLLVAATTLPLIQKRTRLVELQLLVDEAAKQAEAVELLHGDLDKFAEETRFLTQQWETSPRTVPVLAEITKLMPDDSWVSTLELAEGKISIQGQSPSASALIAVIEASPSFHNASFRSPVTQDRETGHERFHLSAEIVARPKP